MPETDLSRILPPNSTPLERAIVDASMAIELDTDPIRTLNDPQRIDAKLLPWLAWARDVLVWPKDADEITRRRLVAESLQLHRRQGTLWAFRKVAALFGATIVRAITPPARLYAGRSLTIDERNAFVARHPQLRIYRHRTRGQRVGMHVGDCLRRSFPVKSDAPLRCAPRAYLYRDGVEAELTVLERTTTATTRTAESTTVTEIALPGTARRRSFASGHPRFLGLSDAAKRFYRITLQQTYRDTGETLRRVAALPSLAPISIRPDAVAQHGQARGLFAGRFLTGCLPPSTAGDRLYQRFYLHDPDLEVDRRKVSLHLNGARLGMKPHHAELHISFPGKASPLAFGRYMRGYLVASDKSRITGFLEAMRAVSRVSDRIKIKTAIHRRATAGQTILAGDLLAGAWIT